MNSLCADVDGYTIAAEVRMERQVHKGSFLLMEGSTDIKRIQKFLDELECSTVNCYGKKNVIDAIKRIYDDGFPGVLGFVDADFDRLLDGVDPHEGLVHSHSHDFDLDVIMSGAFERYINEVGDKGKLSNFQSIDDLRSEVLSVLMPLSCLRFANEREGLEYKLKDMPYHEFCDGTRIDRDKLVEHVSQGRKSGIRDKEKLREVIDTYCARSYNGAQITNGHDACAVIGIMLQRLIGERRVAQTWRSEVEMHLRLTYDQSDFLQSRTFAAIKKWQDENPPYIILAWRLT